LSSYLKTEVVTVRTACISTPKTLRFAHTFHYSVLRFILTRNCDYFLRSTSVIDILSNAEALSFSLLRNRKFNSTQLNFMLQKANNTTVTSEAWN